MQTEMRQFWESIASGGATVAQMLPFANAEALSELEVPEVLAVLPDVENKDILELGAGIGRFTEQFVRKKARSVTCVDFVSAFLEENRKTNGNSGQVKFVQADVTELDLNENSYDVIFSRGLFMYLTDAEVHSLFTKALKRLRPDGLMFFCETCFEPHEKATVRSELIQYRRPDCYFSLSTMCVDNSTFEVVRSKSVQAFVKVLSTNAEICWLLHKIPAKSDSRLQTAQELVDKKLYSCNRIVRYEFMYDKHFTSPGGLVTTEEFVKLLNLQPGEHVLDVGSGVGGASFYMAQNYDVLVTGIDLSTTVTATAQELAYDKNDSRVQFELRDATKCDYPAGSYDVIYCRDVILHIHDKRALFADFLKWLKPGGRLLISDFCCGRAPEQWSQPYKDYIGRFGYLVLPVDAYGKLLEEAGFADVRAEDRTELFERMLHRELRKLVENRDEFFNEFTQADYDELADLWNAKVRCCAIGDQKWGLFLAKKPTNAE